MKTAIRKPKINRKPTRGMKMFMKQNMVSIRKTIGNIMDPNKEHWWHTPQSLRASWLLSLQGKYQPHQGSQERARRARQMREHTHINPEAWI